MISATIINTSETYSSPPCIIRLWTCPSVPLGTDSTALVVLSLPAHNFFIQPWSPVVEKRLKQKAYAIDLRMISVSCLSDNFGVSILNKGDISLLNTIYEVGRWITIKNSLSDISIDPFVIKNRDDIITNQIYFYFDNSSGAVDTGLISVELTYIVIQDRLDNEF